VLLSEEVYIYSNDTLETLEKRIHQVEHKVLVRAIIRMMEGDE
jgi:folate-dependent phosphoribosylglycinamide formyltransferase PurN